MLGFDAPGTCDDPTTGGGFPWHRAEWRADIIQIVLPSSALLGGSLTVSTCSEDSGVIAKLAVGAGCPLSSFAAADRFACPSSGYNVSRW